MDSILCVLLLTSLTMSAALDATDGVLMQVYEDDMTVQNHWEAILHCALTYPSLVRENCSRMWWSHEIDRETHAEEDPEKEKDLYRIKTELMEYTSHLEILTFTERVMGPYKCQAKCGDHLYTVLCEVQHFPSKNRSTLCSEKLFKPDPPGSQPVDEKRHATLLLTLTVVLGILTAVVTSGVLKWLNKRRAVRKRYRQAMEEIARHAGHAGPRSRSNQPQRTTPSRPPIRREAPTRNASLPRNQSNLFFNTIAHSDEVVYQQLPDGSQIVFIPANKLPSYEDSIAAATQGTAVTRGVHGRAHTHVHEGGDIQGRVHGTSQDHTESPRGHIDHEREDWDPGRDEDTPQRPHRDFEEHHGRDSPYLSDTSLPPSYKSGSVHSERESLLGASCPGSASSLHRDESPESGVHHQPLTSVSGVQPHEPHQPLLTGQQDTSLRVPRWILGYPPPAYHE